MGVRPKEKMGERGVKSDLKAGQKRPKIEYVRTYTCAFDRTRAGEWCVCAYDVRTYISKFERTRAVQWVCEGRCGRTSPRQGWTQRSARSNVPEYVRTPNESRKKIFTKILHNGFLHNQKFFF
jgi:hypothetical protein